MERDRSLLFGIFAVQLKKVSPTELMEMASAWAVEPSLGLADRLVKAGAMSESDRILLEGFVDDAVRAHDGDATATMEAFGGEEQVHQTFRGTIVLTELGGISTVEGSVEKLVPGELGDVSAVRETPGRYDYILEYARGGMGRVLLVHDGHLGRDIALKELLPEFVNEADDSPAPSPVRKSVPFIARFLQEARITGQLEHPSIVPVYELGYRKDGSLYYTMKLVRGKSLAQAIKAAGSLRDRLTLLSHFIDLCQAIAYAHSRGVIHRDLKPANVMV